MLLSLELRLILATKKDTGDYRALNSTQLDILILNFDVRCHRGLQRPRIPVLVKLSLGECIV